LGGRTENQSGTLLLASAQISNNDGREKGKGIEEYSNGAQVGER